MSSVGQSLDVQLDKLGHCHKVFREKKSGASNNRPRLKACLEYIREGDALVVTRLDRLARSTLHLCQIAAELERKGVNLQVLDQNIDTGDATGRLLFNMLGAIGQFETEIRTEHQMDGIKKARARGVRFGRNKSLTEKQTAELRRKREQGTLIKTLMKEYGLSKASVYRYLGDPDAALSVMEKGERPCCAFLGDVRRIPTSNMTDSDGRMPVPETHGAKKGAVEPTWRQPCSIPTFRT